MKSLFRSISSKETVDFVSLDGGVEGSGRRASNGRNVRKRKVRDGGVSSERIRNEKGLVEKIFTVGNFVDILKNFPVGEQEFL